MITMFAAVLPIIVLFCGLVLDLGVIELRSLQLQSAADAAAIAAELEAERGTGNWVNSATLDAGINGFTDGSNNVTVTVVQSATSGAYAGRYDTLQATISEQVQTLFMGTLHGGKVTVSATGVALMTPCVYLTGSGQIQPWTLELKSGDLDGNACPIYVNSKFYVDSSANMNVEAIDVAGSAGSSSDSGETFPTPTYNLTAPSDPLAYVTSPTFSGTCNHTSYSLSSGSATLNPGTYCKGITLTNSTVTLNSGLYVITGGSTWSGSTVSGSGVTLYFTSGGGGTDSKFIVQNGSNVTLSAPNTASGGSLAGILVFTDRTWTPTSNQDIALMNSTVTGDGIWYAPQTGVYISSCGIMSATHYLGFVANNLWIGGTNVVISNNYSYVSTGNPMRTVGALVQ